MNKFSILIWLIVMSLSFNKGFSQCETAGTDNQTACDSYTWIDGITYTSSNTAATHTLTNAAGCDSVVTLNLVVNLSSTAPSNVSSSDTVICNNTSFEITPTYLNATSLKWYNNAPTFKLTVNSSGNYWMIASKGYCKSYDTINVQFSTTPTINLGPDTTYCLGQNFV